MSKANTVTSIDIQSDAANVVITSLLQDKKMKIWKETCWLAFYTNVPDRKILFTYDNPFWIKGLYKALKKNKKTSKYYKGLKDDCKEYNLNFYSIKYQVSDCLKRAKKLNII